MIAFLKGTVAYCTADSVVLDVQGVGYQVRLNERQLQGLSAGETLQITTHLQVREDGMELYGFSSPQEKELFLQLTRVSGIGPKTALAIFSVLELPEIIHAIVSNQPRLLSQAPGIGLKTAQRIILELKEKLGKMAGESQIVTALVDSNLPAEWQQEIEITLLALGYDALEIHQAMQISTQELQNQENADEAIRLLLSRIGTP